MEAHGGYLCKLGDAETIPIVRLARESLRMDGEDPEDCSLLISFANRHRVARIAYDAPHTYGRRGARWYQSHHTLARVLSVELGTTVHAYVHDPEYIEEIITYAQGRKVGGDRVIYDEVEFPELEELDGPAAEAFFEQVKERWPLGRLAMILGMRRDELLRLPRASSVLLSLNESAADHVFPVYSNAGVARMP